MSFARVSRSVLVHDFGDLLKRIRDRLSCKSVATVVHTTPEGSSKGKEHPLSPHVVGPTIVLDSGEERVLANTLGKPTPKLPSTVVSRISQLNCFRRSEKAAEEISLDGWTHV